MSRPTRTITLELPSAIAEEIEARVAAGLAQDLGDAVADAVERTREVDLEHGVATEGAARHDRWRSGRSQTVSVADALAEVSQRHEERLKAAR